VKAPFPYFGGKRKVAREVWRRFGPVRGYVEPFGGMLAVLLGNPRPDALRAETVNDSNGWLVNAWRALAYSPDETAEAADWPVTALDIHARGDALFYPEYHPAGAEMYSPYGGLDGFRERLREDPRFHDAKVAGWWLWGLSSWIGDNWGRQAHNARKVDGVAVGVVDSLPHLGNPGKGVNRKRPHLGNPGQGVNRVSMAGTCAERRAGLVAYFRQIADRLRNVRICCGDWSRVMGPAVLDAALPVGIFLDPPYADAGRDAVYGEEESYAVAHDVRAWCLANGGTPAWRIALCGYDEHGELAAHGWTSYRWRTRGGYGNNRKAGGDRNPNRDREIIWFSRGCLTPQPDLFGHGQNAHGEAAEETET